MEKDYLHMNLKTDQIITLTLIGQTVYMSVGSMPILINSSRDSSHLYNGIRK